ncbi:DUF7133 domain-containing protein [Calycomorphotria hydatis]|nr:HEAT repeat domain-containing protein [Calycomorphotria hydatis]
MNRFFAFAMIGVAVFGTGFAETSSGQTTSGTRKSITPDTSYQPHVEPASDEARLMINSFQVPEGFNTELVAAEPDIANPVAFWMTPDQKIYICETFRQGKGVVDNRGNDRWLLEDLAAQTVEDRLAFFKKHLGEDVHKYEEEHDRIRLLQLDKRGRLTSSKIFADGFNQIVDGTGAGVLERNGKVYYTCIPDLYELADENGDGQADWQKSLHTGFGVRVAFRGHDMHGLTIGPEGRLYFSIGDRGFHVKTPEGKTLAVPDTGAVFRCELDGSNLEVFAVGLRNPQELAFDNYGNLFTGDNNSDSIDRARLVHVAEGMDTGWRMYYQYHSNRGPWNRERIWYEYRDSPETTEIQPAHIVPPIAWLSDGPSGLTYYPGVGLSDRYENHFFLSDFRGTPSRSGVRSFGVKPRGATFELTDSHQFIWSILATDCDFGYDGSFYVLDWVNGWYGLGKGRLYRFTDRANADDGEETGEILREGLTKLDAEDLMELLEDKDRRVRQEAQFELATRPISQWSQEELGEILTDDETLPRLHLIWALGQRARQGDSTAADALLPLLDSPDAHARRSALRSLRSAVGQSHIRQSNPKLTIPVLAAKAAFMLADKNAVVRAESAMLLGELGEIAADTKATEAKATLSESVGPLLQTLVDANDSDPALRHAVVTGLAGIGKFDAQSLLAQKSHSDMLARLGILLALRHLQNPEIAFYLADADPKIVLEAARAIHDLPIADSMPKLASLQVPPDRFSALRQDALFRRILNANYRIGGAENAKRVLQIALDEQQLKAIRREALDELLQWSSPPELDRVTNEYRPVGQDRDDQFLNSLLDENIAELVNSSDELAVPAIELIRKHDLQSSAMLLSELVSQTDHSAAVRAEALKTAFQLDPNGHQELVMLCVRDEHPQVRTAARALLPKVDQELAVKELLHAVRTGSDDEGQQAVIDLSKINSEKAHEAIATLFTDLETGKLRPAIHLEVLEAAKKISEPALMKRVNEFSERPVSSPVERYLVTLEGGNPSLGRKIFNSNSALSCSRCHDAEGGLAKVGPSLAGIAKTKNRQYLLESIVDPNKLIAKGFETTVIVTAEGKVIAGIKSDETDDSITLTLADGKKQQILKDDIDDQTVGQSAMPADLIKHVSLRQLRDLVAYLATLAEAPKENLEHAE